MLKYISNIYKIYIMSSEGSFENSVPMIGDTCPFPPPAVPDDETYNTSNYYSIWFWRIWWWIYVK